MVLINLRVKSPTCLVDQIISLEMLSVSIIILVLQILSTLTCAAIQRENLAQPSEVPARVEETPEKPVKVIVDTHDNVLLHNDISNVKNNNTVEVPSNLKPVNNATIIKQDTIDNGDAGIPITHKDKDNLNTGAMIRGFYVFLGLSLLTIFYFLYKTYRLRNGTQPPTQVRKYGVLTKRGDVEMLPLPLDDDDEDDTVFDLGNHSMDYQTNRGVFAHS